MFADYTIYKGKSAMTMKPIKPSFRTLDVSVQHIIFGFFASTLPCLHYFLQPGFQTRFCSLFIFKPSPCSGRHDVQNSASIPFHYYVLTKAVWETLQN